MSQNGIFQMWHLCRAELSTGFIKMMVEVRILGLLQVCGLLFGISMDMLHVKHLVLNIVMAANCGCQLA